MIELRMVRPKPNATVLQALSLWNAGKETAICTATMDQR
jgi:hypothetical protein